MIDFALLGLLRTGPDYGYNLKRRFEDCMGVAWTLNVGQIYQTLRHLETRGLVAPAGEPVAGASGPSSRRLLAITPRGEHALERWLRRPPARTKPVRDETLVRLLVLGPDQHPTACEQIGRLAHVYRAVQTRLLAQEKALPGDSSPPQLVRRLSLRAALLHTEAHLAWLDCCRRSLQPGHNEISQATAD